MSMITKVFTKKGQSRTVYDAFTCLMNLNPNDKFKKQKAAGSLGGASNSGFLTRQGNIYMRTR